MTRTLLIVSAGIEAIHGIRRAKAMGLHVVVSDRDASAPGITEADDFINASTYDADATAAAALAYAQTVRPIDGVLSIGADVPVTVATVANALSLPGLPLPVAQVAADKLAMKEKLAAARIPVPWFTRIESARDIQHLRKRQPIVVKPVDSRGSRGVVRITDNVDSQWAFEQARAISPTGRVMAESYLEGPQISTESIIVGKDIVTPGFSDRNYEFVERYAPYFIENGGDLPSHLPVQMQDDIRRTVALAATALGYDVGTVKGDVVVHHGQAHIIELAPRLSGGYFCTLEIPLSTDVDFVGAAIKAALGDPIRIEDVTPRISRPVVQRYIFPPAGRITRIEGVDAARRMAGIAHIILSKNVGDIAIQTKDTTSRAAMIIATGRDVADARANAARAIAAITIETDPNVVRAQAG